MKSAKPQLFVRDKWVQHADTDATHIFDGIYEFPTCLAHVQLGRTTTSTPLPWPLTEFEMLPREMHDCLPHQIRKELLMGKNTPVPLLDLALSWLREDRVLRNEQEQKRGIKRGRAERQPETTDPKKFFSQYDYYSNYAST